MINCIDLNDKSKIYKSKNYGYFVIINEVEKMNHERKFMIEFVLTKFRKIVTATNIRAGRVKDPYYPSIYGIACIGSIKKYDQYYNILYSVWFSMISRCYDVNNSNYYNYGGCGIKVDNTWLCFENFYNDVQSLENFDLKIMHPSEYHLDKDYLQQNIPHNLKIYSKYTCIWLSERDNYNMRAIDNKNNGKNKYYGVYPNNDNKTSYTVTMNINGKLVNLGIFDDEIVAANVYNNYYKLLYPNALIPLINDVPYVSVKEINKHIASNKYRKNEIEICKLVK